MVADLYQRVVGLGRVGGAAVRGKMGKYVAALSKMLLFILLPRPC